MSGFERKGGIDGLPAIRLGYLTDEASWDAFERTLRWWENAIRESADGG